MAQQNEAGPWQVLVVDDEEAVHAVTRLALDDFSYQGRTVAFTHAYSAADARRLLQEGQRFAVILLDVVMETDHAGLELCNFIRNELQDWTVRILLRTGHPGQAPEDEVVLHYEINGYIEKTSLTMGRLINHVVIALRGYRDICAGQATGEDCGHRRDAG